MTPFSRACLTCFLLLTWSPAPLWAFVHFGQGFGSKWDNPLPGTPALVTWGFVPDGTDVHASFDIDGGFEPGNGVSGTSNITALRTSIDSTFGSGAFDAAILSAFDTWSAATGGRLTFQQIADPGTFSIADPGATSVNNYPDIRISAFMPDVGHSFGNVGAVGFGPPGDDLNFPDALAGDIIFNLSAGFTIAPGNEGDPYDIFPPGGGLFQNELESLFLHELGHAAIGLGHPDQGPGVVMYVGPGSIGFINRELDPDDVAGAQYVYGLGVPGDANDDGLVNLADLQILGDNWQSNSASWSEADFTGDGVVNLADLQILGDNWGYGVGPDVQVVPEPGMVAMLLLVVPVALLRRG